MAKKDELKTTLLNNGYKEEELEGKKVKDLQELVTDLASVQEVLQGAIPETKDKDGKAENPKLARFESESFLNKEFQYKDAAIKPTDNKWTDYVMSLLDDREKEEGNPRTDALRRVAYLLLGDFDITSQIFAAPHIDNGYRGVVKCSLYFYKYSKTVEGCADAYNGNCDGTFATHAIATAETRAEGRALRKALMLTKILVAEENSKPKEDEANGLNDRIQSAMVSGITLMADRAKIDISKLITLHKMGVSSLEELTEKQGKVLFKYIGDNYRASTIPEEIKI